MRSNVPTVSNDAAPVAVAKLSALTLRNAPIRPASLFVMSVVQPPSYRTLCGNLLACGTGLDVVAARLYQLLLRDRGDLGHFVREDAALT